MDTAGKFRVASFRKNRNYSVCLCQVGKEIVLSSQGKNPFAAGISQIVAHVGCFPMMHPKVLVADRAGVWNHC